MNFYDIEYANGTTERLTVAFMSTQEFRLANGGRTNLDHVLEHARSAAKGRTIRQITNTFSGVIVWVNPRCAVATT